jgi:hypothetical protein
LVVYVLERQVEIVDDFFASGDSFNELIVDTGRVEIKETNPAQPGDFLKLIEQTRQGVFGIEVAAIGGYFLSDYVQFYSAGGDQLPGLGEDEGCGFTAGFTPDCGDGAEGAFSAATFADSKISPVAGCNAKTAAVVVKDTRNGGNGFDDIISGEGFAD